MSDINVASRSLAVQVADRLDQILLLGVYILLFWRLMPESFSPQQWFAIMLLVSEGIVVLFVLARRSATTITLEPWPWVVALLGTLTALMVSGEGQLFLPGVGFTLLLIGTVIHLGAKLSLRRSFGIVAANRGIKTGGLYGYVRHPMYFGYMVTHIGFFLSVPTLWNAAVYIVAWLLFALRIKHEEDLLSQSETYANYRETVRYRLIPGLW